eukprot:COSAG05_NODE_291_length_12036_cov_15.352266_6_plen_89_part_00
MKYQLLEYESLTRTLRVNKMKNILCLCYMYRYSTVLGLENLQQHLQPRWYIHDARHAVRLVGMTQDLSALAPIARYQTPHLIQHCRSY